MTQPTPVFFKSPYPDTKHLSESHLIKMLYEAPSIAVSISLVSIT